MKSGLQLCDQGRRAFTVVETVSRGTPLQPHHTIHIGGGDEYHLWQRI